MGVGKSLTPAKSPYLSIMIPVYNEEGSITILYDKVVAVLEGKSYEILFIDDGSTDASRDILDDLQSNDPHVIVLRFLRNMGKSEALAAGFKECQGDIIVTLDGDLQDDPTEIPRLVSAIEHGYDLVCGWKVDRRDPVTKTLPSKVFNWVTGRLTGIRLHDINSGFKAYRRLVIESVQVYGEQHRFIPALTHWKGFRVTEIPVKHHPRPFGKSKFGSSRFLAGFLDLFTVLFLNRFKRKPLHLFGAIGLVSFLAGLLINIYLTVIWFLGHTIGTRPLLQLGVLLILMGIQFIIMGLLGEMLTLSTARGREDAPIYEIHRSDRGGESSSEKEPDVTEETSTGRATR